MLCLAVAINQHYSTDSEAADFHNAGKDPFWGHMPCACEGNCKACRDAADDMPNWEQREAEEKGFERVISYCKKTAML